MSVASASVLQRSAILLAVCSGVAHGVEAGLIASGQVPWPGGSREAVGAVLVAGVGLAGAGAAVTASRGRSAPAPVTVAGLISVVVDLGAPSLPARMLPGVLMLASGATLAIAAARDESAGAGLALGRWAAWISLGLHGLLLLPLLTLGLVAPLPALLGLAALWAVALALALRALRGRPHLVPLAPLTVVATAAVGLSLGERLLGWGP